MKKLAIILILLGVSVIAFGAYNIVTYPSSQLENPCDVPQCL
jgi:hypothetical protein